MIWNVIYTSQARQDLRDIQEYIAFVLRSPQSAAAQSSRIMREISTLDSMPRRYRVYPGEPWHSMGLRYFPVNKYLVFYLVEEASQTVFIVRILYGSRDIDAALAQSSML